MQIDVTGTDSVKELLEFCKFLPSVKMMKSQLDSSQAEKLIKDFGLEATKKQLEKMENWVGIEKKNKSVYLTCKKWFELDGIKPISPVVKSQQKCDEKVSEKVRLSDFLQKYPDGSKIKSTATGKIGVVVNNGWVEFDNGMLPPNQVIYLGWEVCDE